MKISATLKGVKDSIGRRKVYIRIADRNKRRFFSTNIWIDPKQWNKKVINHPDAKNLNERIKHLILSAGAEPQVRSDLSFKRYAADCLFQWEHTKKQSTLQKLASKIKKFNGFFGGKLTEVSPEVLNGFVSYCYTLGNQSNTVWTDLKAVRLIIGKAYREKLISENPFLSFDMPRYRDPEKVHLSKSEIGKIEKLALKNTPYQIAATWFVIACYTGLRFSDLTAFNKSKIKDGRLIVYTSKTGQPVSIKMNEKLSSLFRLVKYKPLPYTNEHYNRLLKAIAAECKIKEKLSSHTARHTHAMLLANAGVSIEVTAQLLGHSSIRQTATYYKISAGRMDKERDKIF